jgi:hypothetical protein
VHSWMNAGRICEAQRPWAESDLDADSNGEQTSLRRGTWHAGVPFVPGASSSLYASLQNIQRMSTLYIWLVPRRLVQAAWSQPSLC